MEGKNLVGGEEDQFVSHIREVLPLIDRIAAVREVGLGDRVFYAAVEYVQNFVIAIDEGDGEAKLTGDSIEFIAKNWFSVAFYHVDSWYRDRYGAALDRKTDNRIKGVVEIAGTPFALDIPTVRTRPGKPGETIWIGFPDGVRDDEFPIAWVEAGPNIDKLDEEDRGLATAEVYETAGKLRYIRTSLMAVAQSDEQLVGLMAGILPRLENAASLLLRPQSVSVQHAYWEMQLACEHALKALRQQQAGTYRETHDLFKLFDDTDPKPEFAREVLKRMPLSRDIADMRYGVGDWRSRRECHRTYRDVLTIVAGTICALRKCGIGRAEFEIGRPPWLKSVGKLR
ncbi:HEPN domain-containing protein [Methylobacterium trifolii]|uniref:HEPN domain-containing protein n=1 Tax=Methylobacterium trifolii TaxID=1003092 RepID=A0ABQ4TXY2_9HYPH|nr:HEPN domain-containing protein [Methylobacterium trifolii]GJE59921.1 hypothetical protein MPOCJGCO_2028 [Methylobacterium trifolii]